MWWKFCENMNMAGRATTIITRPRYFHRVKKLRGWAHATLHCHLALTRDIYVQEPLTKTLHGSNKDNHLLCLLIDGPHRCSELSSFLPSIDLMRLSINDTLAFARGPLNL